MTAADELVTLVILAVYGAATFRKTPTANGTCFTNATPLKARRFVLFMTQLHLFQRSILCMIL
jgi:hypothetical protein